MTSYDRAKPGVKTLTEYLERDGKAIKKTTTIKTTTVTRKSNRFVEARKQWKQFGKSFAEGADADYGPNKPVKSDDEIFLEMNKEKKMKQTGADEKYWEDSVVAMETLVAQATKKSYDANAMRKQREIEEQIKAAEEAREAEEAR